MIFTVIVIAYVAFLIGVAAVKSRKIKSQDDFMVAGRSVPVKLLIGTLVCTWIGSGSLFGGSGMAFRAGFAALWQSVGAWLGILVV